MASTNRCTSFPYILHHTCTHTQIYVCVCVCKSVRPAFLLPLSFIPHLRWMMDHRRPSFQDILTGIIFWSYIKFDGSVRLDVRSPASVLFSSFSGVQLRLPTHDELKVLETCTDILFFVYVYLKLFQSPWAFLNALSLSVQHEIRRFSASSWKFPFVASLGLKLHLVLLGAEWLNWQWMEAKGHCFPSDIRQTLISEVRC